MYYCKERDPATGQWMYGLYKDGLPCKWSDTLQGVCERGLCSYLPPAKEGGSNKSQEQEPAGKSKTGEDTKREGTTAHTGEEPQENVVSEGATPSISGAPEKPAEGTEPGQGTSGPVGTSTKGETPEEPAEGTERGQETSGPGETTTSPSEGPSQESTSAQGGEEEEEEEEEDEEK
uniref:ATSP n=1 Tax=Argas monolakensis TaxID=34602 RepID=Q09JL8_ARGMO|nr:ATSP [Argas monolakensis]